MTIAEFTNSKEAAFLVGFVLGFCMLALLSAVFRGLRPDGVRALRQQCPAIYSSGPLGWHVGRTGHVGFGLCQLGVGHRGDHEMGERVYFANDLLLQSANAATSQPAVDSSEERQKTKELM